MGVVIVTLLVDSQIGYIADFIPEQLSSGIGVAGFIGIAIIFAITQYLILLYIKQSNKEAQAKTLGFDLTSWVVYIVQYFLGDSRIITEQQYSIATLYASHVISYGLWIVILALLAKALFSWYRLSNRNIMVLVLALSMVA